MNRRRFLSAALAAVAPGFLAEAFAAAPGAADTLEVDLAALTAAFQAALASGRAVLVIVRPADEGLSYDRGHAWGELLMHGDERVMAQLGQVEVVVAGDAAVRAFTGQAAGGDEPWAWVLPGGDARVWLRSFGVGEVPQEDPGGPWEDHERWTTVSERNIDLRIAALAASLDRALRGAVVDPADLAPEERAAVVARAVRTLREGVPANTHWATATGCGMHVEGVETSFAVGCGMGSVPERSQRFLYLYDVEKYKRGEVW